jgi:hypothetical protein
MSTTNNSATTSLLYGTMIASSPDFPSNKNPTGWGKSPEYLNIDNDEGLVGHCWKALTITTDYATTHTITGLQTNSNQPFYVEYSSDGEIWERVEGEYTGSDKTVVQDCGPFRCVYTRMVWSVTSGTNGFNAQFIGYMAENNDDDEPEAREDDACEDDCEATDNSCEACIPCADAMFSKACKELQDKIDTHLSVVDDELQREEKKCHEEKCLSRDEWQERLDKRVSEFDQHYAQKIAELQEVVRKKKDEHEERIATLREDFSAERQNAYDETMQSIRNKIENLELTFGEEIV